MFIILKTHTSFVPGAVGTLKKFCFREPPFAGFAGAVLILKIPTPPSQQYNYKDFFAVERSTNPGLFCLGKPRLFEIVRSLLLGEQRLFMGISGLMWGKPLL